MDSYRKLEKTGEKPSDLAERAEQFAASVRSERTRLAYQMDWRHFENWCRFAGREALPASAETVALYLTAHAETLRPATLSRRLVSIAQKHEAAGHETPTRARRVREVMRGIRREQGAAQRRAAPLLVEDLKRIVAALPGNTLQGQRDRALLLIGWAVALRRSEIAALSVSDIEFRGAGVVVHIRRSKTDQEGQGRSVGVKPGQTQDCCPVAALRVWLDAAGLYRGPLFPALDRWGNVLSEPLTGHGVAFILKRALGGAGYDPARYSGHSLRRGLVTAAHIAGASKDEIKKTTGHKSDKILDRYIDDADLFRGNAASRAGL